MKNTILIFLFTFGIFRTEAQPSFFTKSNSAVIDSIAHIKKELNIPGIQITYASEDMKSTFVMGKLRNDEDKLVNMETRFQAASLTKVVAAYIFFKLYDQGLIDLDTPLSHYYQYDRLSENIAAQQVTARMVLTHRTGFRNWEGNVPTAEWRAGKLNSLFKPGTDYKYSGEGFYYLQLAIEEITQTPFEKLVDELVLKPLGMNHTYFFWHDTMKGNTASGHYENGKPYALRKYDFSNAAYTLMTTSEDYTLFTQKAINDGIGLNPNTHRLWIGKATEVKKGIGNYPDENYVPLTLGMRQQINGDEIWIWHTGSNPGMRCFFLSNPETKESLVVFTNSANGFQSMPRLLNLFLGNHRTYWAYSWRKGELD